MTFAAVSFNIDIPLPFGMEVDYYLENHLESFNAIFKKEFLLERAKCFSSK